MDAVIEKLKRIEHGFKHIIEAGDLILKDTSIDHLEFGTKLLDDDAFILANLLLFVHQCRTLLFYRDFFAFSYFRNINKIIITLYNSR